MKWLIASDIHGSAVCCEKLLTAFDREGADRLLLLGDILNRGDGGDAKSVAKMLNAMADKITCVRGNCDSLSTWKALDFPLQGGYITIPGIQGRTMFATHGHHYNSAHRPEDMERGDILLHGHTHVPMTERHESFLCFNPGSVSLPRYGSERSYMTLYDGVFVWKTLDGQEYRRYEL